MLRDVLISCTVHIPPVPCMHASKKHIHIYMYRVSLFICYLVACFVKWKRLYVWLIIDWSCCLCIEHCWPWSGHCSGKTRALFHLLHACHNFFNGNQQSTNMCHEPSCMPTGQQPSLYPISLLLVSLFSFSLDVSNIQPTQLAQDWKWLLFVHFDIVIVVLATFFKKKSLNR